MGGRAIPDAAGATRIAPQSWLFLPIFERFLPTYPAKNAKKREFFPSYQGKPAIKTFEENADIVLLKGAVEGRRERISPARRRRMISYQDQIAKNKLHREQDFLIIPSA